MGCMQNTSKAVSVLGGKTSKDKDIFPLLRIFVIFIYAAPSGVKLFLLFNAVKPVMHGKGNVAPMLRVLGYVRTVR